MEVIFLTLQLIIKTECFKQANKIIIYFRIQAVIQIQIYLVIICRIIITIIQITYFCKIEAINKATI